MSIQLLDNNWNLAYNSLITSSLDKLLLGSYSSNFLAVFVDSSTKNPSWLKGGFVSREIVLPDNSIGLANSTELRLGEINLIQFPSLFSGSYNLYYLGYERLEEVRLKIYEYQGQTQDVLLPQIANYLETNAELQVDFSEIDNRLDAIESILNNMFVQPKTILYRVLGLPKNQTKYVNFWENPEFVDGIKIDSLFIDSPYDDQLYVEVLDYNDNHITEWKFSKSETPYEFPKLEFSKYIKLKLEVLSGNDISGVFIYTTPVASPSLSDIV